MIKPKILSMVEMIQKDARKFERLELSHENWQELQSQLEG